MGANERIRVGVVGSGGRGTYVMEGFLAEPGVDVVAICDVFRPNAEDAAGIVEKAGGKPEIYADYRRVLEREDVDAVLVATPDHWHCPIVAAAAEAGKDAYVEKPLSNAIEPALKAIEAVKRNARVVQVGVQQRSYPHYQEAAKLIQGGLLGPINHAGMLFAANYFNPREEPSAPPEGLDWEMFQGPAERRPYIKSRQRNWRPYYDYGGGLVTDWGVHLVDVVHWYLGDDRPKTATASAVYTHWEDRQQVPDTFTISWAYANFEASFSNWNPNWNPGTVEIGSWGNYFAGRKGMLMVNRSGFIARPHRRRGPRGQPAAGLEFEPIEYKKAPDERLEEGMRLHVRNFLDCVKSRQKPAADIETGFRSTLPTLLALMAIRDGRMYAWDGTTARAI